LARGFSEDRWRTILELSEQVAALPAHERSAYLIAADIEPEVSIEVLELAAEFQKENAQTASSEAQIGTMVGRFLITGLLGSGGMGYVYSACDTELDRPVALKFLRPEVLSYHGAYQRFIREAQSASSLNHPNIVTIHEIVRTGSMVAIVMELAQGVPLRQLCGEWRNSISCVFEIGEQIASALGMAHIHGIVHRDIKPENILLQADGHVKVCDFGLARQVSAVTGASTLSPAGTLRYLSPEQARCEPAIPASDVFSLGLVLHELATGRHPFPGASPFDTVHKILNDEPERLDRDDQIPRGFASLLESMLSRDPFQRPSASEVERRLGELRRGSEQEPRKAEHPRRRALIWGTSLAVIIVGIAILWTKLRPSAAFETGNLHIRPLTSQPGWEADPALSPDGTFIAFTWNDHPENPQIYVKRFDGGEPVKVTDSPTGQIGSLAWSPDGRQIAFKIQWRRSGGGEIRSIPATGGAESIATTLTDADLTSAIDWSPDGEKLVFSDKSPSSSQPSVYAFNLHTGEKVKLTTPPAGIWGDWSPKFSPDGKTIAFKRVTDYWLDEIYLIPAAGGAARRVTSINASIWGHAWMSSGDSLLISCQRENTIHGIWRFSLADPLRPERIQQGAGDLITPAAGRKSERIAWVNRVWDSNIYRASVSGSEPPTKLIASTQRDQNPAVAPDGRIAFVSDRSSSREIWIAAPDGGRQTQVTNFRGPSIDGLMWSPNSRQLTFESRLREKQGVFTMECPPQRQLCDEPQKIVSEASAPAWSADGTAIFYTSHRGGSWQIWRHSLAGGLDNQVTPAGGSFVRETRDGRWLYFSKPGTETIYRIPSSASLRAGMVVREEPVIDASVHVLPIGWDVGPTEILFFELPESRQRWEIRALSIMSSRIRFLRDLGDAYVSTDGMVLSVSSDGKWVYYPRLDSAGTNVIVAESVR